MSDKFFVIEADIEPVPPKAMLKPRWSGSKWSSAYHQAKMFRSEEQAESEAMFLVGKDPVLLGKVQVYSVPENSLCLGQLEGG